jgi:RNA polymerase sigma factor (sigma-70 family)
MTVSPKKNVVQTICCVEIQKTDSSRNKLMGTCKRRTAVQDGDERNVTPKQRKGTKKPTGWPDYFLWMVECARKLVGSNDAEDIANDALYDACCSDRPRPPIENDREVKRLLRVLLKFQAKKYWKKERRLGASCPVDIDDEAQEFATTNRTDVMVDRIVLERVLGTLNTKDRELVLAYYVGGFTADELARNHDMNESTVRSRIARATTRLAEALDKREGKTKRMFGALVPMGPSFMGLPPDWPWSAFRSWFSNAMVKCRMVTMYIGSVAPLALIPSDLPDSQRLLDSIVGEYESPSGPSLVLGARSLTPLSNTTYANPDMPRQERKAFAKIVAPRAKPIADEAPKSGSNEAAESPVREALQSAPSRRSRRSAVDECHNQLGLAFAAFQNDEPKECIAILGAGSIGPEKCPETVERSRLQAMCEDSLLKNRP